MAHHAQNVLLQANVSEKAIDPIDFHHKQKKDNTFSYFTNPPIYANNRSETKGNQAKPSQGK